MGGIAKQIASVMSLLPMLLGLGLLMKLLGGLKDLFGGSKDEGAVVHGVYVGTVSWRRHHA